MICSKSPCTKCTLHKCQTYSSIFFKSLRHKHFVSKQPSFDCTNDTWDLQSTKSTCPNCIIASEWHVLAEKAPRGRKKTAHDFNKGPPLPVRMRPRRGVPRPEQKASSKHISPSSYCHPLVQQSGLASNALTCTLCSCERCLNSQQLDSQRQNEPTRPHRTPHTRPAVCNSAFQLQVCNQVHWLRYLGKACL